MSAKDVLRELKSVIPSDREFETAFATARVSQNYLARYYLRALEMKKAGLPEPEWIPNDDAVINLEHVLPENPDRNWPNVDPETAGAFYRPSETWRLLQANELSISNTSFARKQPVLLASAYRLTKEIGEKKEWGVDQITARQQRLAKLAVATWPIDL